MPPVDNGLMYTLESTAVTPRSLSFEANFPTFSRGFHKGSKYFLNVSCNGFGLPLKILSFKASFLLPIDEANSSRNSGTQVPTSSNTRVGSQYLREFKTRQRGSDK